MTTRKTLLKIRVI